MKFAELSVLVRKFIPRLWAQDCGSSSQRVGALFVDSSFWTNKNQRIEPKTIGGAGNMVHRRVDLRKVVGGLLISIFVLVTGHIFAQVTSGTVAVTWNESLGLDGNDPADAETALNLSITSAAGRTETTGDNYATTCFSLSGTAASAFEFDGTSGQDITDCTIAKGKRAGDTAGVVPGVRLKRATVGGAVIAHLDADEGGNKKQLILTGVKDKTESIKITVNFTITQYDERPTFLNKDAADASNGIKYWTAGDGSSATLLVSQLFKDPDEGGRVFFDGSPGSTDVWICDADAAGNFRTAVATPPTPGDRESTGVPASIPGGTLPTPFSAQPNTGCSVSNKLVATASPAPNPNPGILGAAGNRVLSTEIKGPALQITPNRLFWDHDSDTATPAVARGAGTYSATVYIRAWSESKAGTKLPSDGWAIFQVRVKVGNNNAPQFAGAPTGLSWTIPEGASTESVQVQPVAGDLDSAVPANMDDLVYSLSPKAGSIWIADKAVKGGLRLPEVTGQAKVSLKLGYIDTDSDGNETKTTALGDATTGIRLLGTNLDREHTSGFTHKVYLQVTDNWSDPVKIPITLTVTDVNELEKKPEERDGKKGTQRKPILDRFLLNGGKGTIDLTKIFEDPEGDEITFGAYSDHRTDIVEVDGGTLTYKGLGAEEKGSMVEYMITVTATDAKGAPENADFKLTVLNSNKTPSITLVADGVQSIGRSVSENVNPGTKLEGTIAYVDDAETNGHEAPDPMLMGNGSEYFKATASKGAVTLTVAKKLNYETTKAYDLTLQLKDSWDESLKSKELKIHITVLDANDAPTVVQVKGKDDEYEDVKLPAATVAVKGEKMMDVGKYFEDEDGDRIIVSASSSDSKIVEVSVMGLSNVKYKGMKAGEAKITLTADDHRNSGTATAEIKVTVTENTPPVIDNDLLAMRLPADNTINVGATVDIELDGLFTDNDAGDEIKMIDVATSNEDVLLVVKTSMDKKATLVGRASGMATLTITATDGADNMTPITVDIEVNAEPEEAMPFDPQTLDRVTPIVLDVSGTFTDSDDGAGNLTITAETIGEGADLASVDVMGTMLTVTGVGLGTTEVKLTATDPHGAKATSVFEITIENIEPVVAMAVDDMMSNRVDDLAIDLSETFSDADGGEEFMPTITATSEGEAEVELSVDGTTLMINSMTLGSTTVTLTAEDADGAMVSTSFELTVENILPVVAMSIDSVKTNRVDDVSVSLSGVFTDRDGGDDFSPMFAATIDKRAIASVNVADSMLEIRGLTLGMATVTVEATDADGGMVETSFEVTIENVAPVVAMSIDDMTTNRVDDLTVDLSGTFSDRDGGDDFMPTIMAKAMGDAEVELTVDGTSLMVDAIGLGATTITITATDADGSMIETTFMLTIENLMPVVLKEVPAQTTTRVDDLSVDISDTFMDPDYGDLSIEVMSGDDAVATASVSDSMSMVMIDGMGLGEATITLTASDPDGGMVSTTFQVTVENIDPVVAMAISDQTTTRIEDLSLDISGVFSDADASNGLTIEVSVEDDSIISAMLAEDHMLMISGRGVGSTSVTLTATDMDGAMAYTMFNVEIMNIEPVVANAVADQTTTRVEDLTLDLANTFSDADGDPLTIVASVGDDSILDIDLMNTSLTITSLVVGDTSVTLTATDAHGAMVEAMFSVVVQNVAPVVVNSLSPVTLEVGGESVSQAIGALFEDDGDPLTYRVSMGDSGIASGAISGTTATFGAVSRGSTTATVIASDPHGGEVSVSAAVTVGDGELKAVAAKSLAGFGRALLASVSSSVGSRLMTDSRSTDLTLDAWAPVDQNDAPTALSLNDTSEQAWNVVQSVNSTDTTASSFNSTGLSGVDALRSTVGNQFALNLGTSDNPSQWSVWGNLDRQSYEGTGYDGMASNVYLGVDVTAGECWMFGVAVASNSGESDYSYGTATQTMDLSLTTVLPYVSYQPSDNTSLWGVAGFGSGELDTTVVGASNDVSDLSANITMVGGRQHLTSTGRLDLALRADAAVASIETDSGAGAADGLMADVNRIRAGLEGSFTTDTGQGGTLSPFGQVSLRSDGGDGDTGTGIEISGGVRMASDVFTLEVRGRTLAMHSADDYKESGFSLMATLNPSASATGVSVTLAPRWGADAQASDMLWQDTVSVNPMQSYGVMTGFGNDGSTKSMETKIGYGMLVGQERYLLTPFVDLAVSDSQRQELLVGATLRQMIRGKANLDVSFALGRVEERTGENDGKIGLNATLRF